METKILNDWWVDDDGFIAEGHGDDYKTITSVLDTSEETTDLIVTAVNSCKQINPDNPLAVAKVLPEIIEAFKKMINDYCPQTHFLVEAEALLKQATE